MEIRPRICPKCRKLVVAMWETPRFGVEAMLVVGTCGLYLPIWFWKMVRSGWICPRCASRI
jgi:hypothetical protein